MDLEVGTQRKFVPFEIMYHLEQFGDFWSVGSNFFEFVKLDWLRSFGKYLENWKRVNGPSHCYRMVQHRFEPVACPLQRAPHGADRADTTACSNRTAVQRCATTVADRRFRPCAPLLGLILSIAQHRGKDILLSPSILHRHRALADAAELCHHRAPHQGAGGCRLRAPCVTAKQMWPFFRRVDGRHMLLQALRRSPLLPRTPHHGQCVSGHLHLWPRHHRLGFSPSSSLLHDLQVGCGRWPPIHAPVAHLSFPLVPHCWPHKFGWVRPCFDLLELHNDPAMLLDLWDDGIDRVSMLPTLVPIRCRFVPKHLTWPACLRLPTVSPRPPRAPPHLHAALWPASRAPRWLVWASAAGSPPPWSASSVSFQSRFFPQTSSLPPPHALATTPPTPRRR
jgi:hypothetical protein